MRPAKIDDTSSPQAPSTSAWRDAVVMAGGAAFALAAALGLHSQLGLSLPLAGVLGLVVFVMLAAIQVALRRSDEVSIMRERLTRLEAQLGTGHEAARHAPAAAHIEPERAHQPVRPTAPESPRMPEPQPPTEERAAFATGQPARAGRTRVVSGWSTQRQAHATAPRPAPPPAHSEGPPPLPSPAAIKVGQPGPDRERADQHFESHSFMPPPTPEPKPAPPEPRSEPNPVGGMIGQIANELGAYRPGEDRAEPTTAAMEKVAAAPHSLTSRVLDAVEAGRVEILLQPIVSLEDRTVACYEAFPRLRDASGTMITPAEYVAPARAQGVLAEIEKIAAFRTINILQRLEERQKLVPIFLNISRQTLVDGSFFREISAVTKEYRPAASGLVFEFAQREARAFNDEELENLDGLTRMGFNFSIDEITDLEMDFVPLIERQFAFAKLRAAQLLHGLPSGGTTVPSAEIGPMFEEAGLQVMVEAIEDDGMLAHVETSGLKFGQGPVFAEPSPVKAEVLAGQGVAA